MIKQFSGTTDDLFFQLSNGAMVVTPNNRLSNQLLTTYFDKTQSSILSKPLCLPYQAFLNHLFKHVRHTHPHITHPLVLNVHQERYLWQDVLQDQSGNTEQEGLITAVQDASTRCFLWQIEPSHADFSYNPLTAQFQLWRKQFQDKLNVLGAITPNQLAEYLIRYSSSFNPSKLIWACFDDYTPQQKVLQDALVQRGFEQYRYDLPPKSITTMRYAAKDTHDELQQMVHWLNERLAAGDKHIAVVVPDIQAQSTQLQRYLHRYLPTQQFNISLGQSLADYPLVAHALTWLNLDNQKITHHQAQLLLHSPYLKAGKTEFLKRAQLMQDNSILQETIISLPAFINTCKVHAPELAHLCSHLTPYPATQAPGCWSEQFKLRLTQMGFPGEYPLNSSAYQCFQRFIALFDELLPLALVQPSMTKTQALSCLRHLAQHTIFQERKTDSPIQILGPLEASGCTFDSVWVCGLTDQCLPQKTNLSAFIPIELQRALEMPHALPERELQYAQQLLQRLQFGSINSVFSYPRMMGDMPNMPSPLITHLPAYTARELPLQPPSQLIPLADNYVVSLKEGERIAGGTALLANQAKCPFRAFSAHRLHAKRALDVFEGPDLSERGQIMHKVMDTVWTSIGSQKTLLTLSNEQLDECIHLAIINALEPYIRQRVYSFPALVQSVEITRLTLLVRACLEWEKQRPCFDVEALEQTFTMNIAGIDFKVRVDRLDRVGDKKWVIDYKTSLPGHKPWYDERPEEPQLLLYSLLDENINSLLFLQLKTGRLTCSGLSEDALAIKGITTLKKGESWSERLHQWHQQLTNLAIEFKQGHCAPAPLRESTCLQCDFQSLCRVDMGC